MDLPKIRKYRPKWANKSNQTELNFKINRCSREISKLYRELGLEHRGGVWDNKHLKRFDAAHFRGDNVYVWQTRVFTEIHYFVSYLYALKVDKLGLNNTIVETGSFGADTFNFDGRTVSRDFIDSIIEINFLEEKFQLSKARYFHILDIGAGYGRFAKRIHESFSNIEVSCIDAIPLSTCLSRIYLEDEIKTGNTRVYQLNTIDEIKAGSISLAINIHSFSEMSIESVKAWVNFLVEKKVENVFIVPNGSNLELNDGTDFGLIFEGAGYRISSVDDKYKYADFLRLGIYPSRYFILKASFL